MKSRRIIAMLLCAMMLASLLPAAVFADDAEEEIIDVFFDGEETIPAEDLVQTEESENDEETPEEDEILPGEDEITADEELPEDEILPEEPETEGENEFESEFIAMGTAGVNATWYIMQDGGLVFVGSGEMTDFYMTYTPWYEYRDQITSVYITGLSSIGIRAFVGLSKLAKVTIGNSVVTIKEQAFAGCGGISEITVPASVRNIASHAFGGCSGLSKITFMGDAPTISYDAFYNLNSKAYYNLIANGWDGMLNNYGATYLSWIGYTADIIGNCGNDATWSYNGSTLTISGSGAMTNYTADNVPWKSYRDSIKKIEIKGAITSIGDYAFRRFTKLTEVLFTGCGSTLTSIGKYAFSSCTDLRFVNLPASLTTIGDSAFMSCANLNEVWPFTKLEETGYNYSNFCELLNNSSITSIESYAFAYTAIPYAGIPANATLGVYNPFMSCSSLSQFFVPEGTKYKVVNNALISADGKKLIAYPCGRNDAEFTVPEGITSLGDMSAQSAKFSSIKLPQTLTYIGYSALSDCVNLTEVTVPKLVNYISSYAFTGSAVNTLRFEGAKPTFESKAFQNTTATAYYPGSNSSWNGIEGNNYGGTITWKVYNNHAAPVITTVANHADYMIVSWGKVEGAVSYKLAYREGSGAWQSMDVTLLMVDSKGNPRVNLKNLKQGANYTFIAYANFADGTQTKSASATQTRLLTPTVTAKANNGYVALSWNGVEGGSQYKIYYREKGGSWQLYAYVGKNITSVNIKENIINSYGWQPLIKGRTYEFAVLTATSVAGITSGFPTNPTTVVY